tara:strand:+ start:303 stop:1160 length:858 start_codon:yes stop_codon:yes gene_type:complete
MNTSVIISLGVTLVFCTLIYFFLRKRIDSVDKKVNLLMQLVKEHHEQVQQQSQIIMREKVEQPMYNNLIPVSDEEDGNEEYDTDDSEEISDTEETESMNFLHKSVGPESISLSGAETNIRSHLETLDQITLDFEDFEDFEDVVDLKDTTGINLNSVSLESTEEKSNTETNVLEGATQSEQDGQNGQGNQGDQSDQDDPSDQDDQFDQDDSDTDNMDIEVVINELTETVQDKTINTGIIEHDITKLKVKDLKLKAKELGLEGYSSLKKKQLITLIVSHKTSVGIGA